MASGVILALETLVAESLILAFQFTYPTHVVCDGRPVLSTPSKQKEYLTQACSSLEALHTPLSFIRRVETLFQATHNRGENSFSLPSTDPSR
jgi:hypothetical protein